MELIFSPLADDHLVYWKKTGNIAIQNKISQLLKSIIETPFKGIGKPEPLKYSLSGAWSRRINHEHRLVYEVENNTINILSLKGHY